MQTTLTKGEVTDMALETKMLIIAIGELIRSARDLEHAYETIKRMANVEGIDMPNFNENSKKEEPDQKEQ